MATFGQGVNASLGKTDYSNYLAGALQGARGVAGGGQSIGQGVANLGQQVGAGIEAYAKKKQEDKELSASNKVNSAILELFGQSDALTTKQKLEVDSMMLSYAQLDGVRERNAFLKNALSGVMNMAELGEKTATAESLRNLRDAQTKNLNKDPIAEKQNTSRTLSSLAKGYYTAGGGFDAESFRDSALRQGILQEDIKDYLDTSESIKELSGGKGFLEEDVVRIKIGEGQEAVGLPTGNGGFKWQIIGGNADPAQVVLLKERQALFDKMIDAIAQDNRKLAMSLAGALDLKDYTKELYNYEELKNRFGGGGDAGVLDSGYSDSTNKPSKLSKEDTQVQMWLSDPVNKNDPRYAAVLAKYNAGR